MAKMTLLELTQSILNDMNADEVNGIDDTPESQQVARIIQDTYNEIISTRRWPHLSRLVSLTPQGPARPTHMDTNPAWVYLDFVKYNKRSSTDTRDRYDEVWYLGPEEFLELTNQRNSSNSDVQTVTDPTGVQLLIFNDRRPQYWTTFDDEVLVFDSYDNLVDTNLQESKFQCWGNVEAVWESKDLFVPDLPAKAFSYLLSEAKSTAFAALRQTPNVKEEQKARRTRIWLGNEKWRNGQTMQVSDFGRRSSKGRRSNSRNN